MAALLIAKRALKGKRLSGAPVRCVIAAAPQGLPGNPRPTTRPPNERILDLAQMTFPAARVSLRLLAVALAAVALAACETTGTGIAVETAKAPEPPMTHTRAAEQCWMSTERGNASLPLDKRADLVDKCIEQKMKTASGGAAPAAPAPEAKKKETSERCGRRKRSPLPPMAKKTRSRPTRTRPARSPDRRPGQAFRRPLRAASGRINIPPLSR